MLLRMCVCVTDRIDMPTGHGAAYPLRTHTERVGSNTPHVPSLSLLSLVSLIGGQLVGERLGQMPPCHNATRLHLPCREPAVSAPIIRGMLCCTCCFSVLCCALPRCAVLYSTLRPLRRWSSHERWTTLPMRESCTLLVTAKLCTLCCAL